MHTHTITKDTFGQRLRSLRTERKLSRAELARRAGLADGVYARYERGECAPGVDVAHAIARALDVSLDYLVGDAPAPMRDKSMLYRLELLDGVGESQRDRILYMLDLMLKDAHVGSLDARLS